MSQSIFNSNRLGPIGALPRVRSFPFSFLFASLIWFGCSHPAEASQQVDATQNELDENEAKESLGRPDVENERATVEPLLPNEKQELDEILRFEIEGDADGIVQTQKIWKKIFEQAGVNLKEPLMKRNLVGSIDLKRPRSRWLVRGLDFALRPTVRLSLNADRTGIVVEIDQNQIEAAKNAVAQNIREAGAAAREGNSEAYGLKVVHPNPDADHTVLIVHGFNSSPAPFANVIELLQGTDSQIATFYYPSQLGVKSAADRLSNDLKRYAAENDQQRITILSHSMGGLCARYVLENEELDCQTVDRLVMIAPPNHGTEIAQPGLTGEVFDGVLAEIDRPKIVAALKSVVTEVNYALKDLEPNSQLLQQLSLLSRNPRVSYHILLGNKAPLSREQVAAASTILTKIKLKLPGANLAGQHVSDTLKQLSKEIANPNGDGVVSVASGQLADVDDIVVLEFSHNEMFAVDSDGWQILKDEILKRVSPVPQK